MINMRSIITSILIVLILLILQPLGCNTANVPTEGAYTLVYEAPSDVHYHGICFPEKDRGWIVGDSGRILHTDDGGTSWEAQESGTSSDLYYVYFSDKLTGFILGSDNTIGVTTNGGDSWIWQHPEGESDRTFMDISFVDEQTGWIVGNRGEILHTKDGGMTWTFQDSCTYGAITSVHFLDAEEGWATAVNRIILHTTDGGDSWTANRITIPLPGATIFDDVFFIDRNNGWIATNRMASSDLSATTSPLIRTTDGGETWFVQASLPGTMPNDFIIMVNENEGWLMNWANLFYTNDGGNTWIPQLVGIGNLFIVDIFIHDMNAWVLGFAGEIYRYQIL